MQGMISSRASVMGSMGADVHITHTFVAPTHPAYLITTTVDSPHVRALHQGLKEHSIVLCLQTNKNKLAVVPNTPTDRYFIVVDDSKGPIELKGELLTLNCMKVSYPNANSLQSVLKKFDQFIGLGKTLTQTVQGQGVKDEIKATTKRISTLPGFNSLNKMQMLKELQAVQLNATSNKGAGMAVGIGGMSSMDGLGAGISEGMAGSMNHMSANMGGMNAGIGGMGGSISGGQGGLSAGMGGISGGMSGMSGGVGGMSGGMSVGTGGGIGGGMSAGMGGVSVGMSGPNGANMSAGGMGMGQNGTIVMDGGKMTVGAATGRLSGGKVAVQNSQIGSNGMMSQSLGSFRFGGGLPNGAKVSLGQDYDSNMHMAVSNSEAFGGTGTPNQKSFFKVQQGAIGGQMNRPSTVTRVQMVESSGGLYSSSPIPGRPASQRSHSASLNRSGSKFRLKSVSKYGVDSNSTNHASKSLFIYEKGRDEEAYTNYIKNLKSQKLLKNVLFLSNSKQYEDHATLKAKGDYHILLMSGYSAINKAHKFLKANEIVVFWASTPKMDQLSGNITACGCNQSTVDLLLAQKGFMLNPGISKDQVQRSLTNKFERLSKSRLLSQQGQGEPANIYKNSQPTEFKGFTMTNSSVHPSGASASASGVVGSAPGVSVSGSMDIFAPKVYQNSLGVRKSIEIKPSDKKSNNFTLQDNLQHEPNRTKLNQNFLQVEQLQGPILPARHSMKHETKTIRTPVALIVQEAEKEHQQPQMDLSRIINQRLSPAPSPAGTMTVLPYIDELFDECATKIASMKRPSKSARSGSPPHFQATQTFKENNKQEKQPIKRISGLAIGRRSIETAKKPDNGYGLSQIKTSKLRNLSLTGRQSVNKYFREDSDSESNYSSQRASLRDKTNILKQSLKLRSSRSSCKSDVLMERMRSYKKRLCTVSPQQQVSFTFNGTDRKGIAQPSNGRTILGSVRKSLVRNSYRSRSSQRFQSELLSIQIGGGNTSNGDGTFVNNLEALMTANNSRPSSKKLQEGKGKGNKVGATQFTTTVTQKHRISTYSDQGDTLFTSGGSSGLGVAGSQDSSKRQQQQVSILYLIDRQLHNHAVVLEKYLKESDSIYIFRSWEHLLHQINGSPCTLLYVLTENQELMKKLLPHLKPNTFIATLDHEEPLSLSGKIVSLPNIDHFPKANQAVLESILG